MSVEPGFGGQKFMPEVLQKARHLRELMPKQSLLSIDGGIDPTTIGSAAAAGVQIFVAGSSIFDESDYKWAIENLRNVAGAAK